MRGVTDDDGIAGKRAEAGGIESAAQRDNKLNIESGASLGDGFEGCFGAVLESSQRGVDERAAVEALPGEIDIGAKGGIDEGAGVVEEGRPGVDVEFEDFGELGDLGEW